MSRLGLYFVDRVYTAASVSFPKETPKKYVVGHAIDFADSLKVMRPQIPPVVLFVGRVTPRKRLDILVLTSAVLRKRGVEHSVRIIGDTPDADYLLHIKELIAQQHLEETVNIMGSKVHSELSGEYTTASVLVNPSETGGIDKVVLEALGYGLPAIALSSTYAECVSDVSLLVESQSPVAYANAVELALRTMAENPSAYSLLKAKVNSRHSLQTLSERIFSV
jgi:glycosyltransferase involved in cell wall biosynthesis